MIRSSNFPDSGDVDRPIRVGLIGVTGYGLAHFEGIHHLESRGEAKLCAATIINPEEAEEQVRLLNDRQVPIYSDYLEMLDAVELDWVCIPTGISWHMNMTVDCLRRGLDVLVEKPLAPTLQDVDTIQNAEREFGKRVCVGFQYLYQDDVWDIKRRLVEGEIGEIRRIDAIGLWPRARSYFSRNEWAGMLHDGHSWVLDSPLHNALAHIVNMTLFWSGPTLEQAATIEGLEAETYRAKPLESFDTIRSVVRLNTGFEASVVLSHSSINSIEPEIRIEGTEGYLHWRFTSHTVLSNARGVQTLPCLELVPLRERMFRAIASHLLGRPARLCTTDLARESVKWVNAVHDTAPIQEVPPAHRKVTTSAKGEIFDTIDRMEYFALRSFFEGKGFKEIGAPWAVPPSFADVSDYDAFEARLISTPSPSIPEVVVFD